MNNILIVAIIAMVVAQIIKIPVYYLKHNEWDISIVFSTGSMPSSHTAFVIALTTGVGIKDGINSTTFAISMVFALITLHDAIKVRGESGKQAKVINEIVMDITGLYSALNMKDSKKRESKLKELIGHTTSEVLSGIFLGIFVAVFCMKILG